MRPFTPRRQCTSRSGFSLVELLTVLGIITILMALSIPALISARRQAQITQCQSNLHQLTVALINYSVEFKGEFPPNVGAKKAFWYNNSAIGHYIRGPSELAETVYQQINGVFVCPADLDNTVRSYSMNTFASSEVSSSSAAAIAANPPRGKLFKAGASPGSKLILFTEAFAVEDFPEEDPNPIGYSAPALVGFAPKLVGKRFGATGARAKRPASRHPVSYPFGVCPLNSFSHLLRGSKSWM